MTSKKRIDSVMVFVCQLPISTSIIWDIHITSKLKYFKRNQRKSRGKVTRSFA